MINYKLDSKYVRTVGATSLGMTEKYYKEGYWYKKNLRGYEGKAEHIVTIILNNSNFTNYVQYEECMINGIPGCRSKNFITNRESVLTFDRMYSSSYGASLRHKIASYGNLTERVRYVTDFVKESSGLDCTKYLKHTMEIDMLTLNVDRHFGNLAIITTDSGYREAPMFDFGASFFSLQHVFKPEMTLKEKLDIMTPQPFADNFKDQMLFFGEPELKLDYENILKELNREPDEVFDIVKYQLEACSKYFKEIHIDKTEDKISENEIKNADDFYSL